MALVLVIVGAFAWGLAMFVVGRGSVIADTTPLEERELAQAQLVHIDRALETGDATVAGHLIDSARMPATPTWNAAIALRRQRLNALRSAPAWSFLQLSPHPLMADHWLAVGRDRLGVALLSSTDAGAHWNELRRLTGPAVIRRANHAILVATADATQLGWYSSDDGASWRDLPWPSPTSTTTQAVLGLSGNGRVIAATPDTGGYALHVLGVDGSWSAIAPSGDLRMLSVKAIVTLASEALILTVSQGTPGRTLMISSDTGRTWFQAPAELQPCVDQPVTSVTTGEPLHITFGTGKTARFSAGDGAFLGFGD